MKNLLIYFSALLFLSSCAFVKSSLQTKPASPNPVQHQKQSTFIEGIAVKPESIPEEPGLETIPAVTRPAITNNQNVFQTRSVATSDNIILENFSITQFKYAIRLDVPVENLFNRSLYELIDNWWATPYRMGGMSKRGIDCSAFVQTLMLGAFAVQLPRTAREQHKASKRVSADKLCEGDLVFFNTRGGVSHVGVYLQNNRFVHSSTSSGVMISSLNDSYWSRKFIGGGRILQPAFPKP